MTYFVLGASIILTVVAQLSLAKGAGVFFVSYGSNWAAQRLDFTLAVYSLGGFSH